MKKEKGDRSGRENDVTAQLDFAFLFVVVVGSLQANLAPVCALLGGVLGQEVVKFLSGKG